MSGTFNNSRINTIWNELEFIGEFIYPGAYVDEVAGVDEVIHLYTSDLVYTGAGACRPGKI